MAGSTGVVTVTDQTLGVVKLIKYDWVTGSSSQTGEATGASSEYYNGEIIEFVTIPDSTAAPAANYDITVTDGNSIDVLLGYGANRHTSSTEYIVRGTTGTYSKPLGWVANSLLTINVTNAGTEKRGIAYLYIR